MLESQAGIKLSPKYTTSSGGGVPWVVDERAAYYQPHTRARFSCAGCAGDVVPEKDLIGCWPLWMQACSAAIFKSSAEVECVLTGVDVGRVFVVEQFVGPWPQGNNAPTLVIVRSR